MQDVDFDQLTQLIYAGAVDDNGFGRALHLLATLHRCRSSAFVYSDRISPGADIELTHGPFSDPGVRARYQTYAADDPAPLAMSRLPIGQAAATNQLFSPEFLARSRFLHEFYRPLGFEEALGGPVASGEGRVGIVAIHRGPDREPFGNDEIHMFGRLLPHFAQALDIRRRFFKALDQTIALGEAIDAASSGVMTFDGGGVLTFANTKARTILARNDGLSLARNGQLRVANPEADSRLRAARTAHHTDQAASILRVRRNEDARPYFLRFSFSTAAAPRGFTVYVSDPDSTPKDAAQAFEAAFGLSRQSAALVAVLASGGDLTTFAATNGVTRNTAKFHLQAAFAATGTARQVDLVREATGVLKDLGVKQD